MVQWVKHLQSRSVTGLNPGASWWEEKQLLQVVCPLTATCVMPTYTNKGMEIFYLKWTVIEKDCPPLASTHMIDSTLYTHT